MSLASCIYRGEVRHRRLEPVEHEFRFPLFMMYLDLGELERVFRGRWLWSDRRAAVAWFRRRDHLGDPAAPLDTAVRELVRERCGWRPDGPIRLLTHLRYLGYCFNPLSLYYCFGASDGRVRAVVAEVSNTPWGERHCYVLDGTGDGGERVREYRNRKEFHVSPFMGMDVLYRWRLTDPGPTVSVHIESLEKDRRFFDSTLTMTRREITTSSLAAALLRYPAMTAQVILAIHYQALRLWLKGAPFHPHPRRSAERLERKKV